MKAKVVFLTCYGPKKESKNHVDTTQTTHLVQFRTITIGGAIMVKIKHFIPENASFQGCFTEVSFDTSEGTQLSYFQNGYF